MDFPSGVEPTLPIPNRVLKRIYADDTWMQIQGKVGQSRPFSFCPLRGMFFCLGAFDQAHSPTPLLSFCCYRRHNNQKKSKIMDCFDVVNEEFGRTDRVDDVNQLISPMELTDVVSRMNLMKLM